MKSVSIFILAVFFCAVSGGALFAQDRETGLGVQMSSDSSVGLLLYAGLFELGLRANASLYDLEEPSGQLLFGGHLAYVFRSSGDPSTISVGFDAGSYLGDISYKEYIDVGLRLGFNYLLGGHLLVSGLLYPAYISTREIEGANDFSMVLAFPKAAIAVSYLF